MTTQHGEKKRLAILEEIGRFQDEHRRPPTYRDLMASIGSSTGGMSYNMKVLVEKGLVEPMNGRWGAVLTEKGRAFVRDKAIDWAKLEAEMRDAIQDISEAAHERGDFILIRTIRAMAEPLGCKNDAEAIINLWRKGARDWYWA